MVLTGRFAAQSQTAAIIFLFVNILIYFVGASVSEAVAPQGRAEVGWAGTRGEGGMGHTILVLYDILCLTLSHVSSLF